MAILHRQKKRAYLRERDMTSAMMDEVGVRERTGLLTGEFWDRLTRIAPHVYLGEHLMNS